MNPVLHEKRQQVAAEQLRLDPAHDSGADRFTASPVGHQFDRPEHAFTAHFADDRMLRLQRGKTGRQLIAPHKGRVLHDALVFHGVEGGNDRRHRQRVPAVGQAAGENGVVEIACDGIRNNHSTGGNVARVDALGEANQVGHRAVGLEREPASGAPEAGHDLVEDQHDAIAITERTHAGQVPGRREEDAGRAGDRLQENGSNRCWAFALDDAFEVAQGAL